MKTIIHAIAGLSAMLLVIVFQTATILSELAFSHAEVAVVKFWIVCGIGLMVVLMAGTGASGKLLAIGRAGAVIDVKTRRMMVLATNGLLIMVPSAVFLWLWSSAGRFGALFYTVQAIEIACGLLQLTLLALNARDGFQLTRRKREIAKARRAQG